MKVAVMQPYFFPYSGYFSLIHSVEHFMFFDDVQYIKKSWMSRNRLLNIEKEEPYFIRPTLIKPDYKALFTTVKLDNADNWKVKLIEQLNGYKNKAPFFTPIKIIIEEILELQYDHLTEFNINSTITISKALGLTTKFDKYTDHNFWFEEKPGEGDWGRIVAKEIGATHYINSSGGESFIFPEKFTEIDMKLGFIQPKLQVYSQLTSSFLPGLSIIDVLLFNGIEETARMIANYEIKWKN
ncbi:WbqC family protein [Chryseobacterium sp. PBS4-4]|uniref:WbqC family protein n=1 Tax=Chryseobacterium edaphi TaxID=2976532 RepID=A0ABT2W918_9FLAO|nr:WbqC family protein [Chryseobacterium edaphi]MCU7618711.1 WbqC family protein [Chryseobacterium edaphi]